MVGPSKETAMSYPLLHLVRIGESELGTYGGLYLVKKTTGNWTWLSQAYELPWKSNAEGKSKNYTSRIKVGTHKMHERTSGKSRLNGGKGWRLELEKTDHHDNIQVPSGSQISRHRGLHHTRRIHRPREGISDSSALRESHGQDQVTLPILGIEEVWKANDRH